jgi:hypothetical protein
MALLTQEAGIIKRKKNVAGHITSARAVDLISQHLDKFEGQFRKQGGKNKTVSVIL